MKINVNKNKMTWKPVYENVYDVFMNTWLHCEIMIMMQQCY